MFFFQFEKQIFYHFEQYCFIIIYFVKFNRDILVSILYPNNFKHVIQLHICLLLIIILLFVDCLLLFILKCLFY